MKKLLAVGVSCIIYLSLSSAIAGTETNGGDGLVAEFKSLAYELLKNLQEGNLNSNETEIVFKLTASMSHIEIATAPMLLLDGKEVDAINQPQLQPAKITISHVGWARLNITQKRHLILHELLPVSNYYDKDYKLSSALAMKSSFIFGSQRDIIQSFYFCKTDAIASLRRSDLERLRFDQLFTDPVGATANMLCLQGLQVLIKADFEMNYCVARDFTTLQLLEKFKDLHVKRFGLEKYQEYYNQMVNAGASMNCAPAP